MKWIKNDSFVIDTQSGDIMCVVGSNEDKLRDKMIELAPELFYAALSFVEQTEAGRNPTRAIYNEIKEIFERVPQELIDNAKLQV